MDTIEVGDNVHYSFATNMSHKIVTGVVKSVGKDKATIIVTNMELYGHSRSVDIAKLKKTKNPKHSLDHMQKIARAASD